MKTRKTATTELACKSKVPMPPQTEKPPKLLILPEHRSPDARILTLAHPRTSQPCRYYFDPELGIYEFTKIAALKSVFRSWLIAGRILEAERSQEDEALISKDGATGSSTTSRDPDSRPISDGYVIKNAELLIATPIDYLFLVLPSFTHSSGARSPTSKGLFLSADDLLDKLSEESAHLSLLRSHESVRKQMEARMAAVCDLVDAGDEKMYRLKDEKLLEELVLKANRMVNQGLPASMEERFVSKALEMPILTIRHEESSVSDSIPQQTDTPASESTTSDTLISQTSTDTSTSAESAATDLTVPDTAIPAADSQNLQHLLRLRTALTFITTSYIPTVLSTRLNILLASQNSPIDFKSLDSHLAHLAKLRAEALAARSLGDFSRKRNMFEGDEDVETRAEKKRKKEEEEKLKKAGETRGIRDLKKVDTKGMKKMSEFFGKAAAKKK